MGSNTIPSMFWDEGQSSLQDFLAQPAYPALKHWAISGCPSGTAHVDQVVRLPFEVCYMRKRSKQFSSYFPRVEHELTWTPIFAENPNALGQL